MRGWMILIVFLSVLMAAATAGFAQTADPLQLGIKAFNKPDYEAALEYFNATLKQKTMYSKEEIAECHRYLGMTYVAYENKAKAKGHFVKALELNPDTAFDALTSPKILEVFDEAQMEIQKVQESKIEARKAEGPETNRRKIAGWSLVGVGGASLATSGICYYMMWDKAWQYEDEKDSSKADDLQAESEMFALVSGISAGIGLAAVGVGAYLLATDKTRSAAIKIGNVEVAIVPTLKPGVCVGLRF